MLWGWRNDYETRMASVNTEPVLWPEHMIWFSRSLTSPERKIFIAEHQGTPIGTVRLDYLNGHTELSWTIAPEHRGKGYGVSMLRAAITKEPDKDLYAVIKMTNAASLKIAQAAGFYFEKMQDNLGVWKIDKRRDHNGPGNG